MRPGQPMIENEAARARPTSRLDAFAAAVPWLGPAIWMVSAVYFVVQVVVASSWRPSYSWSGNTISDLGNTACRSTLCSPRHAWMNAEFLLLGAGMIAGSVLISRAFSQ